jgi:hypothetical protein
MEDYEWTESWDDVDDADASPSRTLARRLALRRRQAAARKSVVPAGGPQGASPRGELSRIYETMKRLEEKQDEQTRALAAIQSRASGEQTGDLFRYSLSAAALQATSAAMSGDPVAALTQVIPVAQNYRGIAPSFAVRPISTIAFPLIAVGAFAARKPRPPMVVAPNLSTGAAGGANVRVSVVSPDGADIRYVFQPAAGIRMGVTKGSAQPQNGVIEIPAGSTGDLEVRAFQFFRSSDPVVIHFQP